MPGRTAAERIEGAARCELELGVRPIPQQVLLLEVGTLLRYADPKSAFSTLNAAIQHAERDSDKVVENLALAERGFVRCFLGDVQTGTAEMERAVLQCEQLEEEDSGTVERSEALFRALGLQSPKTRLDGRRSILIFAKTMIGRLAEAASLGEPLRETFFRTGDRTSPASSIYTSADTHFGTEISSGNNCLGLAALYAMLGRIGDSQLFFELAERYFQDEGLPFVVTVTASSELYLLTIRFQTDHLERRRFLQELARISSLKAQGMGPAELSSTVPEFAVQFVEGDWSGARKRAEAWRVAHSLDWYREVAVAILAELEWNQGNVVAAMKRVEEVLSLGPSTEPGDCGFVSGQALQRIASEIALDRGDLATANAWIEAHDRWLDWSGAVLGRADGELVRARYARSSGDTLLAREHSERALEFATEPHQPLSLIAAHRFIGELDTQERRYLEAEQHFCDSLALANACQAPFETCLDPDRVCRAADRAATAGERA